jgi:hypothetical protein
LVIFISFFIFFSSFGVFVSFSEINSLTSFFGIIVFSFFLIALLFIEVSSTILFKLSFFEEISILFLLISESFSITLPVESILFKLGISLFSSISSILSFFSFSYSFSSLISSLIS